MIEAAISARLLADLALAELVGARIWWHRRDQGSALPALVLHRISEAQDYTYRGAVNLRPLRIQIDVHGATALEATRTLRTAEAALSGASWSAEGVEILGSFIEGGGGSSSEGSAADPPEGARLRFDAIIHWRAL
ncbi:DUF3168 domain-containing protein [Neomegalonema sp.]|uniref:tail completion protein gp17 n=1 Tax=Neomegalonema sp. TaxID=2039713 RepID=UPI0026021018|nr:DUF3168 domain-containing protein [Neomegalonema sp.]MDD2870236.1 DUF3168 domain-containing protein [Neomegalonema sp.]